MGEMCDYVFRYPRHNSSTAYHSLCANSVEPNCAFNMVKWIEFGISRYSSCINNWYLVVIN